jgi:hypothetical protein
MLHFAALRRTAPLNADVSPHKNTPMRTRRLIAFVVFAAAVGVAARSRTGDFMGMLDPVLFLIAVLVAIIALVAAIFDIRLGPPNYEDSGFGMHEPVGIGLGKLGLLIFAAAPLFIAARGIYRGVIPALIADQDVALSDAPLQFLVALGAWVAIGIAFLVLSRLVNASSQTKKEKRRGR